MTTTPRARRAMIPVQARERCVPGGVRRWPSHSQSYTVLQYLDGLGQVLHDYWIRALEEVEGYTHDSLQWSALLDFAIICHVICHIWSCMYSARQIKTTSLSEL